MKLATLDNSTEWPHCPQPQDYSVVAKFIVQQLANRKKSFCLILMRQALYQNAKEKAYDF